MAEHHDLPHSVTDLKIVISPPAMAEARIYLAVEVSASRKASPLHGVSSASANGTTVDQLKQARVVAQDER